MVPWWTLPLVAIVSAFMSGILSLYLGFYRGADWMANMYLKKISKNPNSVQVHILRNKITKKDKKDGEE